MNHSRQNNICNKEEKSNFVVIHSHVKEIKNGLNVEPVRKLDKISYRNEIVEYSDDVSEQIRMIYAKISNDLESYFKGIKDLDYINENLRQHYDTMKNYCMNAGVLSENNIRYKYKLLKDIYRSYRHNAVMIAVDRNDTEGKEFALEHFQKEWRESVIYYNSDYYYRYEELRHRLITIATDLAVEEKIENFEVESIDKRKRYVYDYEFNYAWIWKHKIEIPNAVKIDEELVFPKHIKILYGVDYREETRGKLCIHHEEEAMEFNIKRTDSKEKKLEFFNLLEEKIIPFTKEKKWREFLEHFIYESKIKQ